MSRKEANPGFFSAHAEVSIQFPPERTDVRVRQGFPTEKMDVWTWKYLPIWLSGGGGLLSVGSVARETPMCA